MSITYVSCGEETHLPIWDTWGQERYGLAPLPSPCVEGAITLQKQLSAAIMATFDKPYVCQVCKAVMGPGTDPQHESGKHLGQVRPHLTAKPSWWPHLSANSARGFLSPGLAYLRRTLHGPALLGTEQLIFLSCGLHLGKREIFRTEGDARAAAAFHVPPRKTRPSSIPPS